MVGEEPRTRGCVSLSDEPWALGDDDGLSSAPDEAEGVGSRGFAGCRRCSDAGWEHLQDGHSVPETIRVQLLPIGSATRARPAPCAHSELCRAVSCRVTL